jgi:agmatine/peptidylarginine deiminase
VTAEYESSRAVLLAWAGYSEMVTSIARHVVENTEAEVWVMSGPSALKGVPASRYRSIGCRVNTPWVRDYGPFGLVPDEQGGGLPSLTNPIYRHWQYRRDDDAAPACLGNKVDMPVLALPIIMDGGNFMVDSQGNLFMTKRTYLWNSTLAPEDVDEALKRVYNLKSVHALPYAGYPGTPSDGTGHIDMFVKLISDDTVLIAETEAPAFRPTTEAAVEFFENLKAPGGGSYKIVRVPARYTNGVWHTFTNSLLVDNLAIVPTYAAVSSLEPQVVEAYQSARGDIEVRFVNSDASISSGGAVHCITQLVPKG